MTPAAYATPDSSVPHAQHRQPSHIVPIDVPQTFCSDWPRAECALVSSSVRAVLRLFRLSTEQRPKGAKYALAKLHAVVAKLLPTNDPGPQTMDAAMKWLRVYATTSPGRGGAGEFAAVVHSRA
jgi:hypothetical protein